MTESTLRITSLVAAACGILSAVVFALRWGSPELLRQTELYRVYVIVAAAAAVSRGRSVGFVVAAASTAVFALGAYTYLDLLRHRGINDITLVTFPCQHLLAIAAILVAVISFVVHRARTSPNVA
jgi:hypothetical protein